MDYKDTVLILDLDGTLLSLDEQKVFITDENINALNTYVKKGGTFSIATGRSRFNTLPELKDLPINFPISIINGAISLNHKDYNDTLRSIPLNRPLYDKLLAFFEDYQKLGLVLVNENQVYGVDGLIEAKSTFGFQWEKLTVKTIPKGPIYKVGFVTERKDTEHVYEQLTPLFENEDVKVIKALRGYIELFSNEATKGKAVRYLMEDYNIQNKTLICAGDQLNDLSMLETADVSLVPKNGNDYLRKHFQTLKRNHNESIVPEILSIIDAL